MAVAVAVGAGAVGAAGAEAVAAAAAEDAAADAGGDWYVDGSSAGRCLLAAAAGQR